MGSALISPLAVFTLRALGASVLFWLVGCFTKKEKVDKRDFPKIFIASMLGLFVVQLAFLFGIAWVSPMDWSILMVLSPIFTMFIAAIVLKEPITLKKAGGVALSFIGIVLLILSGTRGGAGQSSFWGVMLGLLNAISFALYLGIFRPLISKYSVVTFMKWMFLFSLLVSLPFSAGDLLELDWAAIPSSYYLELGFLVFFSTFVSYALIPFGQQRIRPTLVSMYSYVQPIIASVISIYVGMEKLSLLKVLSAIAVVAGVIIVSRSKALKH